MKNKRSALFTWNEETDRQFGLNEPVGRSRDQDEDLDTREEQIKPRESPSGVVKAVESSPYEEKKQPHSPVSRSYSDKEEELETSVQRLKKERE